jgi:hypothetical protein
MPAKGVANASGKWVESVQDAAQLYDNATCRELIGNCTDSGVRKRERARSGTITTATTQRIPDTETQQAIAQSEAQYQQKCNDSIQLVNELSLRAHFLGTGA